MASLKPFSSQNLSCRLNSHCLTVGTGEVVEGSDGVVAVGEAGVADVTAPGGVSADGADRADAVIERSWGERGFDRVPQGAWKGKAHVILRLFAIGYDC